MPHLLVLFLLVVAIGTSAAPCPRGILTGQVTHVRDGDTIVVGRLPIRLIPTRNELSIGMPRVYCGRDLAQEGRS
jgi:hypothetical protein